jgi:hypothetical protein
MSLIAKDQLYLALTQHPHVSVLDYVDTFLNPFVGNGNQKLDQLTPNTSKDEIHIGCYATLGDSKLYCAPFVGEGNLRTSSLEAPRIGPRYVEDWSPEILISTYGA